MVVGDVTSHKPQPTNHGRCTLPPVRVYLAAAMTNASRDPSAIQALVEHLESQGHEVPTRHVADEAGREDDAAISDGDLARRDLAWLADCHALVAEVSAPSHGVGIEVATAVALGIPVLLLYRAGTMVSRLLLGLAGTEAVAYADIPGANALLLGFLSRVGAAPRVVSRGG